MRNDQDNHKSNESTKILVLVKYKVLVKGSYILLKRGYRGYEPRLRGESSGFPGTYEGRDDPCSGEGEEEGNIRYTKGRR